MRRAANAILLATLLTSCGGKDLCLNCDADLPATPENTVAVTGSIRQLSTFDPLSAVVVVICADFPEGDFGSCPSPFSAEVDSSGAFRRESIDPGDLRVGFWIDRDGSGVIDEGDAFAELDDSSGQLRGLAGGLTVELDSVAVDFAAGQATATIAVSTTPTPGPEATATP